MGKGLFSKIKNTVIGYPTTDYLILGPSESGKTTALFQWKYPGENLLIVPSIGLNLETIFYKDKNITLYDVSIGDKYKLEKPIGERIKSPIKKPLDLKVSPKSKSPPPKSNFKDIDPDTPRIDDFNINGLIFFVDSYKITNQEYEKEAQEMLESILEIKNYSTLPLLIFANKQDLKDSLTTEEVAQKLNLYSIRNRKWFIRESISKKGVGLQEGLEWLVNN